MTDPSPSFPNEQTLVQNALEHVRRMFKGNGIKLDTIKVISHKVSHHTMNAGTYLELKPVTSEKSQPGKVVAGMQVASREAAMQQVNAAMVAAASNSATKAQIANVLLARPDQGFGLNRQAMGLDFLKKEYTWHEPCTTCQGRGQAACPRCQGRRVETCIKCTGRGLMPCPLCQTTGLIQGQKCSRCFGQRYVPCDMCQRTGMMRCRICSGTGAGKCQTCGGQGWKSFILSLMAQALTYFEYDAKSVPKGAADMFETQPSALLLEGKIKVKGRMADEKENVLGANYEVDFPYGDIVFMAGKKEIKANLFGTKGDLVHFPYVLDKIVLRTVEDLEEAAGGSGSVAEAIQKATRYRVIAQGFLIASRTTHRRTVETLLKQYDIGLSLGMAEKIALLADETTLQITRKPRYYGLFGGLVLVALMDAAYYLLPVRSKIAGYLPDVRFDFVLDIAPILLGAIITTMAIQFAGAKAIGTALGHLTPKGQKSMVMPKARSSGWFGYAGTILITLGMMEAAANTNSSAPYWYEMTRNLILQLIGG